MFAQIRMMFAQILTFLEAYFCDNLITGLRAHPKRLAEFAAKDGSIQQTEITASDVLSDPDHVRKVSVRLGRSIVRH